MQFQNVLILLQKINRQLGKKIGQGAFGQVFEACIGDICPTVIKKSLLTTPSTEKIWKQEVDAFQALSKSLSESKTPEKLIPEFYNSLVCGEDHKKYGSIEEERYTGNLKQRLRDPFYSTFMEDPSNRFRILGRVIQLLLQAGVHKHINLDAKPENFLYRRGSNPEEMPMIVMGI